MFCLRLSVRNLLMSFLSNKNKNQGCYKPKQRDISIYSNHIQAKLIDKKCKIQNLPINFAWKLFLIKSKYSDAYVYNSPSFIFIRKLRFSNYFSLVLQSWERRKWAKCEELVCCRVLTWLSALWWAPSPCSPSWWPSHWVVGENWRVVQ